MNSNKQRPLFAGIEAGGTKFNCVLAYSPNEVLARGKVPTTTPQETFTNVFEFFDEQEKQFGEISAWGIASFGPVGLHKNKDDYGFITATPKPHWTNTDVIGAFKSFRDVPTGFDTDVNGAALGEMTHGAAQGIENFTYVTVGTGIGAGVYANGKAVNGSIHPEVGHMLVPPIASLQLGNANNQDQATDVGLISASRLKYLAGGSESTRENELLPPNLEAGTCRFHAHCLTNYASGPALESLWQCSAKDLPEHHIAWEYQAHYLAMMCINLGLFYAPEKIILGGGVMDQQHLFAKIHQHYDALMGNYMTLQASSSELIIPPGKPGLSGEIGALVLAEQALNSTR